MTEKEIIQKFFFTFNQKGECLYDVNGTHIKKVTDWWLALRREELQNEITLLSNILPECNGARESDEFDAGLVDQKQTVLDYLQAKLNEK